MLVNYFSIIRNYVLSVVSQRMYAFSTKTTSRCFSNELLQHYVQESFDGYSFVSQSKFDTYAVLYQGSVHTSTLSYENAYN